jgi:hypothetical protein
VVEGFRDRYGTYFAANGWFSPVICRFDNPKRSRYINFSPRFAGCDLS